MKTIEVKFIESPPVVVEVKYGGFLGKITRKFPTLERAETWARQVGVWNKSDLTINGKPVWA